MLHNFVAISIGMCAKNLFDLKKRDVNYRTFFTNKNSFHFKLSSSQDNLIVLHFNGKTDISFVVLMKENQTQDVK